MTENWILSSETKNHLLFVRRPSERQTFRKTNRKPEQLCPAVRSTRASIKAQDSIVLTIVRLNSKLSTCPCHSTRGDCLLECIGGSRSFERAMKLVRGVILAVNCVERPAVIIVRRLLLGARTPPRNEVNRRKVARRSDVPLNLRFYPRSSCDSCPPMRSIVSRFFPILSAKYND